MKNEFKVLMLQMVLLLAIFFASCSKNSTDVQSRNPIQETENQHTLKATILTENFNTGTKGAYADANITLSTGIWDFNNALLGSSSSDRKNGTQSARITSTGKIVMMFDKSNGAGTVTVNHALFGSDANSTWQLLMSTNQGSTWSQVGATITTSTTTLTSQAFTVNQSGNIRFEIVKTSGTGRINIDDFVITDYNSNSSLVVSV